MHTRAKQLSLTALVFVFGMLLLSGCDRKLEAYDSLRSEIIADLAQALAEGDADRIEKSLDRLESLTDQHGFVAGVRTQEERRRLIKGLNHSLAEGKLDSAARIIEDNRSLITERAEFLDLPRMVESLKALDTYLNNRPYQTYAGMASALRDIQSRARALSSSPAFVEWLQAELERLAELQRAERREKLNKLLDVCDQAAISRPIDLQIIFAQLRDFAGDASVSQLYAELRDGKTGKLNELFRDGMPPEDPLERKSIEICLLACRDKLSPSALLSYSEKLSQAEPQSLSGYVLRIELAAHMNRPGEALLWTRKYLDAGGQVEAALLDRLVPQILLPPEHFNARIWRVPYPSVGDIIDRMVHWQTFHAGGPEK